MMEGCIFHARLNGGCSFFWPLLCSCGAYWTEQALCRRRWWWNRFLWRHIPTYWYNCWDHRACFLTAIVKKLSSNMQRFFSWFQTFFLQPLHCPSPGLITRWSTVLFYSPTHSGWYWFYQLLVTQWWAQVSDEKPHLAYFSVSMLMLPAPHSLPLGFLLR